ncbi:hypothetical protein LX36DRAFT_59068 [Colletotrichum falcatum]|nr:hypothetical protein LX36DRAFT_59068 [Colletotrichum falcatum]
MHATSNGRDMTVVKDCQTASGKSPRCSESWCRLRGPSGCSTKRSTIMSLLFLSLGRFKITDMVSLVFASEYRSETAETSGRLGCAQRERRELSRCSPGTKTMEYGQSRPII